MTPDEGESAHRFSDRVEAAVATLAREVHSDWWQARRSVSAVAPVEGAETAHRGPTASAWRRAWALDEAPRRRAAAGVARVSAATVAPVTDRAKLTEQRPGHVGAPSPARLASRCRPDRTGAPVRTTSADARRSAPVLHASAPLWPAEASCTDARQLRFAPRRRSIVAEKVEAKQVASAWEKG